MGRVGRRPVLDEGKRGQILAILSVGCSQSVAAEYVGSQSPQSSARPSGIRSLPATSARRNATPNSVWSRIFAARRKKSNTGGRRPGRSERGFPEKYAPRGPDVITIEQIGQLLAKFSNIIVQDVPERYRTQILRKWMR